MYWNATELNLKKLGHQEIKLYSNARSWTDLLKRAKIILELNSFKERFKNPVYDKYKFAAGGKGVKSKLKNTIVAGFIRTFQGEKGLERVRRKMEESERKSDSYEGCKTLLQKEKPDLVFCASQRPVNAIAPILAAKDIGIPTACFIFSWDNLPKATKVIETDYYLVWSDYMKNELQEYYPHISKNQIKVTGTPQFEIHFNEQAVIDRDSFYKTYNLNIDRKYLCFSGDDITTSPHDEHFLRDVALVVKNLNSKGENIGILFRPCPVDFSGRYQEILEEFSNLIVPILPKWTSEGNTWNQAMPKQEDMILQTNIVAHSFMVINVASSMVFDFATKGKPCAYLNYILPIENLKKDICEIYSYVHFESMPDKNAVFWIDDKKEIQPIILKALHKENQGVLEQTNKWFARINKPPASKASNRIVEELLKLN